MTEKSFYSSRQPLLLPPPSSLVLSPPPHLHQQVRTAIGQNFMVIFLQSGIQAKPLGFFQLLPHPPIPCNSSYFYVDHDQPDLNYLQKRYLPGLPPPTCVLLYPYVPRRHAELDARSFHIWKQREQFPM